MDCGGDTAYVFIAMIVLSDENGIIKHTAESLARVICKDVESVRKALYNLERQDQQSNMKAHQGRRIVPLYEIKDDETRGWLVVNKAVYRGRASKEDRREYMRDYMRGKRKSINGNKAVNSSKQQLAQLAHTDTDTDTDKNKTTPPDGGSTVWDFGKSLLAEQGLSTKSAGALIGSWLREWPEAEVAEALRAAAGKADVRSYVAAVLKAKPKKSSGGQAGLRVAMP